MNLEPLGYKFMALWTVYEMACFFVTLDGDVPVTMHYKFQQFVQMTVVVPCPQLIDRVGHCSYVTETGTVCNCAEEREDSSVQFFGELVTARRCATTGAGVLTVLFLCRCRRCSLSLVVDIPVVAQRQYGTEAVWGNCVKTVDVHKCRF